MLDNSDDLPWGKSTVDTACPRDFPNSWNLSVNVEIGGSACFNDARVDVMRVVPPKFDDRQISL
jgi:hypothetical protein